MTLNNIEGKTIARVEDEWMEDNDGQQSHNERIWYEDVE